MCDSLDRHSKDGTLGNTWKKRFRNKWPTMTTLMHQSEITIRPYLEHEYADPHEIMAYQNCRIPDWDGSSETSWSAAKSLEQDMHDEDTLPKINQISHVVKKRRCDKVCRTILCGFLILSIVMAVAAAIGLSFFLNLHQNDGFARQDDHHHHGNHVPPNITTEEWMYLSKIFCSVVKRLLVETDFPVKNGLAGCHASLLFVENSEDLHIEMHVSPREGYTIKEKILRILSEGVLKDMMNSLQTNEIQTSTTENGFPTEHSTLSGINFAEYETTTNQQSRVVNDNNINESTTVPRLELVNQTSTAALPVLQDATTEGHTPSVSAAADNNQNAAAEGKEINIHVPILPPNFENPTTLPPIIMPKETVPAIKLNAEHLRSYETTTDKEETSVQLGETTKIPETTAATVTVQRSDGPIFKTQDSVTNFRSFTSTENPKDKIPWLIEPVPVVTKLFNPVPVDIANNIFNGSSRIGLPNIRPPLKQKESPKIVESLMAGGVMKLPFKTNSNFRFLFSSDSKMKPAKQNILNSPEVEIKVKSDNAMDAANTDINNKAFNSQNIKYSRTEALDLFTERPKSLKKLRSLRAPTSSTKSVVQRKADLQKNPKRAIDVTEFGTQRLVLKV